MFLKNHLPNKKERDPLEIGSNKLLGAYGEHCVVQYLESNNYIILSRNYKIKGGEIDIIAQKGDTISFIEVKLRNSIYFDNTQIITYPKIKKIINTAKYFISLHNIQDKIFRFDVAILEKKEEAFDINYIENAFAESDYYYEF